MSEHAWTLENLAAYVAGGLEPAERERFERHLNDCADCSRARADADAADGHLMALFADVRPGPMFEDRMIRTLRKPRQAARRGISTVWVKASLAVAALAMLAVLGAGITALLDNDWLPDFAGSGEATGAPSRSITIFDATDADPGSAFTTHDRSQSYTNIGPGTGTMASYGRQYKSLQLPEAPAPDALAADILNRSSSTFGEQHSLNIVVRGSSKLRVKEGGWAEGDTKREETGPGTDRSRSMDFSLALKPNQKNDPQIPAGGRGGPGAGAAMPARIPAQTPPPSGGPGMRGYSINGPVSEHYFAPNFAVQPLLPHAPSPETKQQEAQEPNKQEKAIQPYLNLTRPAQQGGDDKKPAQPLVEQPRPAAAQRYIIRTGDIEFEVDSFDAAAAIVRKLVAATKGALVATENSDRLTNGKVRGAIVVRMPPEQLDKFVLDLRQQLGKTGELKGQKIGSQEVSKTYIDLESRLKAARTMEQRLLKIIKDGKGEIKDLVAAEKELGVWNTKIEEIEGELRYYQNLVSLSTLTINLTEKEIRTAAAVREIERINAGVEVDDVEKGMREVLKAVEDAKGRVTRSEMKQHAGGQFTAQLVFDIEPDRAGSVRDRLNQLGTVARLEIDRLQTPEGGEKLPRDGKLERGNTQFIVSLYNLANVKPEETVVLRVAAVDVAEAYRTVRAAIVKAKGRIMGADLDQKSPQQVVANLTFAVPRDGEATVRAALGDAGEVLSRSLTRVAAAAGATDGKDLAKLVTDKRVEYKLELISAAAIEPRETVALAVEVTDVEQTIDVLTSGAKALQGRVVEGPKLAHEPNGRVTALIVYEVPLAAEPALAEKLRNSGHVRQKVTVPNQQAPEGKLAVARFVVTLVNAEVLVPRDEGVMAEIRSGLSYSLRGLSVSVRVLIVGVLFVLPWVLLIAAAWWVVRRIWGRPAVVTVTPALETPTTPPAASA